MLPSVAQKNQSLPKKPLKKNSRDRGLPRVLHDAMQRSGPTYANIIKYTAAEEIKTDLHPISETWVPINAYISSTDESHPSAAFN